MTTATKRAYNRVALVFDFDDTLAPDSYRSLLHSCGIDQDTFDQERVQPLVDAGWEEILAKLFCLIEESKRRNDSKITREHLANVGHEIKFFDGVPAMFDRVRTCARTMNPDIEVDFYLLSSGILEIVLGTPIADEFTALWGCQFHFNKDDEITFVKHIVTHGEKVRYLLQISKGMHATGKPVRAEEVYREVPPDQLHIPLNQMIYVGDGASDIPVFDFLSERQGLAIGVFKGQAAAEWHGSTDMEAGRRVQNLAPVDYGEDGELMQSLTLAVESVCKQIALRQLGRGE